MMFPSVIHQVASARSYCYYSITIMVAVRLLFLALLVSNDPNRLCVAIQHTAQKCAHHPQLVYQHTQMSEHENKQQERERWPVRTTSFDVAAARIGDRPQQQSRPEPPTPQADGWRCWAGKSMDVHRVALKTRCAIDYCDRAAAYRGEAFVNTVVATSRQSPKETKYDEAIADA